MNEGSGCKINADATGPYPSPILFMTQKTNAVRLLDQLGIPYELRAYEVDPNDLTAESVAEKVGLPPEQVFKTLVARGDRNGICLAVVPGDSELDLKALATAAGDRKIQLVPMKELLGLTGYIRGGVTAFAGKKDYPVYVDETIELFDVVSVSAGTRGLQIFLKQVQPSPDISILTVTENRFMTTVGKFLINPGSSMTGSRKFHVLIKYNLLLL